METNSGKFGSSEDQSTAPKPRNSRRSDKLIPMRRNMKTYCISVNEVDQLTAFNDLSSVFFGIGSFLAAILVESCMFMPKDEIRLPIQFFTGIFTFIFYAVGGWMIWKRGGVMKRIIAESLEDSNNNDK